MIGIMIKHSRRPQRGRPLALSLAFSLALAGCAADIIPHGTIPTEDQIAFIKPGVSTQSDVLNTLGTASTVSIFDDGVSWIYIGSHSRQVAVFEREELDRRVLVIRYGKTGVVEDVVSLTKENGADVNVVVRATPTRGKDLSLIQELLNNVGRFDSPKSSGKSK